MSASLSEAKSESKSLQAARVRLSKLLEDLKLVWLFVRGEDAAGRSLSNRQAAGGARSACPAEGIE